MMNKIISPILAPSNDRAVYLYKGQLMLIEDTFQEAQLVLDGIDGATHLKWSRDGRYVAFLLNAQLNIVTVATAQVIVAPIEHVIQYEWGKDTKLYITRNDNALYEWRIQGEVKLLLQQAVIEAYDAVTERAIVKRNDELFSVKLLEEEIGQLQAVTQRAGLYTQVAFSFTGQYVAYISESANRTERHVIVYDFELGITQNLTEMLDVYAGDAMRPHMNDTQGVKEIQWIETDALYFLLSSDGDVRLYYADLYGSVFPASPESEHVMSYAVASSGNWALYVADEPLLEARLDWFDITIGEARTIVSEPAVKVPDLDVFYEMVEVSGVTYYVWGYIPPRCEGAVIVWSGQRRMLGNGYEPRIGQIVTESRAIVYVNHPGAIGYGAGYANTAVNEGALREAIAAWLAQKVEQLVVIQEIVQ